MKILDRYLLRQFTRVLLVSFLSLTGLILIIDLFGNLEEFITYARHEGSLPAVLLDYYGPRLFMYYDRTSALLVLIAAIFTLTGLQRRNELTALMAGGIPKTRIARPLLIAAVILATVAAANREFVLPRMRDQLSRNAQDWLGQTAKRLDPRYDYQTGILLGGAATLAAHREIRQPSFRLPGNLARFGRQLTAKTAFYLPPAQDRPGGYLLDDVIQPEQVATIPSSFEDGAPRILTAHDTTWVKPNQCFVASNVTFDHLAASRAWRQYSSTAELIRALRNPSLDYEASTRVTVHARLVQPLLDVSLLLLGLPLVLARHNRNLFVAAAQCLGLVAGFHVVVLTSHAMGNNSYMVSPALAAWLPLLVFGPLAFVGAHRHWE